MRLLPLLTVLSLIPACDSADELDVAGESPVLPADQEDIESDPEEEDAKPGEQVSVSPEAPADPDPTEGDDGEDDTDVVDDHTSDDNTEEEEPAPPSWPAPDWAPVTESLWHAEYPPMGDYDADAVAACAANRPDYNSDWHMNDWHQAYGPFSAEFADATYRANHDQFSHWLDDMTDECLQTVVWPELVTAYCSMALYYGGIVEGLDRGLTVAEAQVEFGHVSATPDIEGWCR